MAIPIKNNQPVTGSNNTSNTPKPNPIKHTPIVLFSNLNIIYYLLYLYYILFYLFCYFCIVFCLENTLILWFNIGDVKEMFPYCHKTNDTNEMSLSYY